MAVTMATKYSYRIMTGGEKRDLTKAPRYHLLLPGFTSLQVKLNINEFRDNTTEIYMFKGQF